MKIKGGMTAKEIMQLLEKDPDYTARMAKKEKEAEERILLFRAEQKELLRDLAYVGIQVDSVWDLVNTNKPYPKAIPVLLDHLKRPYLATNLEGIARALAVPESIYAWSELLDLYLSKDPETEGNVKFAIGLCLSVIATKTNREREILELLKDRTQGDSRLAFLDVIALSKNPDARRNLHEFKNDPDLKEQVRWHLNNPGKRSN